jgi:precorrin-2/cobalt-factor-2 C20-methyltransferase
VTGRVFAVGVGPGDPELLTRKAERVIREAAVIVAPSAGADDASYALSIVQQFLDPKRQEIVVHTFPMTRDQETLNPLRLQAAREIAGHAAAGRNVAFITIGDPLLYSTFQPIFRILGEEFPSIVVEFVPGISSISAAASAAALPLALADETVAILPATTDEAKILKTLMEFDTIVLLKISRAFDRVYDMLVQLTLDDKAVFVRRVGSADEEVIFDLKSLVGKKLDYLSLLIVKK